MSFTDHKITQFQHKITDLPDQPNLPADELKARFDSSPEELRQAHNALCDDADRLDDRVSGIIAETFGDTITEDMLSDELQDEIDAKAEAAGLTAETTARETADDAIETTVAKKCELYVGVYTGTGVDNRTISLGFRPKAVLVMQNGYIADTYRNGYQNANGGIAISGWSNYGIALASNGFTVRQYNEYDSATGLSSKRLNIDGNKYVYLAFK